MVFIWKHEPYQMQRGTNWDIELEDKFNWNELDTLLIGIASNNSVIPSACKGAQWPIGDWYGYSVRLITVLNYWDCFERSCKKVHMAPMCALQGGEGTCRVHKWINQGRHHWQTIPWALANMRIDLHAYDRTEWVMASCNRRAFFLKSFARHR